MEGNTEYRSKESEYPIRENETNSVLERSYGKGYLLQAPSNIREKVSTLDVIEGNK